MKERENAKRKRAITDLNVPNGSQDIPIQKLEFEQDGRRRFLGFLSHFYFNVISQT